MKHIVAFLLILPLFFTARGQSYVDEIVQYRKRYIEELVGDKRAPVKPSQVKYISFFPPNKDYCVSADFTASPGSMPFLISTHSGKQKPFKEYGVLNFQLHGELYTLHVYQSIDLMNDAAHRDDLFVPFNDMTNYETTFAGGRYIDLSINDIKGGKVMLDFNKCYNPYCAYADGYSCPIPPKENYLHTEVSAGEKMFQR